MAMTIRNNAGPTSAGKMLCDLGYGKANYATSTTSFSCMKVVAPFVRSSASGAGRSIPGTKKWTMAGASPSHSGFSSERSEHAVGTIILVQATRMSGGMRIAEAGIFLRLRETGPLYEVYGKLPTSTQNVIGDEVAIATLRGDLLTLEDLKIMGLEIPRVFRQRYMQADEIAELFAVSEIQQEIKARPQLVAIATADGVKLQEVAVAPARRLRFRKGDGV